MWLLLSQQNVTGSAGPLSLGERVGVRDFAIEPCPQFKHPHPQGEGVKPLAIRHILLPR
jgi:hypothetical protein